MAAPGEPLFLIVWLLDLSAEPASSKNFANFQSPNNVCVSLTKFSKDKTSSWRMPQQDNWKEIIVDAVFHMYN